jgi:ABC-type molybdate transport system ATPase subunit
VKAFEIDSVDDGVIMAIFGAVGAGQSAKNPLVTCLVGLLRNQGKTVEAPLKLWV